ncbi:MAG: hypothetical protein R3C12_22255 [Planctomycetaceae bacterium]
MQGLLPLPIWAQTIDATLATPRDYPCLTQAVIPEDHVAIVVDPDTPAWTELRHRFHGTAVVSGGRGSRSDSGDTESTPPPEAVASAAAKIEFPCVISETILSGTYLASTAEGDRRTSPRPSWMPIAW